MIDYASFRSDPSTNGIQFGDLPTFDANDNRFLFQPGITDSFTSPFSDFSARFNEVYSQSSAAMFDSINSSKDVPSNPNTVSGNIDKMGDQELTGLQPDYDIVPKTPTGIYNGNGLNNAALNLSTPTEGNQDVWQERFAQELGTTSPLASSGSEESSSLESAETTIGGVESGVSEDMGPLGLMVMASQAVGNAATDAYTSSLAANQNSTFQQNVNKPGLSAEVQANQVNQAQNSVISQSKLLMGGLSLLGGPVGALIGYALSPSMDVSSSVNFNTAYSAGSMFNPQNPVTVASGFYSQDPGTNIISN